MTEPTTREIRAMLVGDLKALVAELLPHAVARGNYWQVGNFAGDKGQSLQIKDHGGWTEWDGGTTGDVFDLIARCHDWQDTKAHFADVMTFARQFLGLDTATTEEWQARRDKARARAAKRAKEQDEKRKVKQGAAKALWLKAAPDLRNTAVHAYLWARGVSLAQLAATCGRPGALRFSPDCYHPFARERYAAMLAQISGPGGFLAVHMTYLEYSPVYGWRGVTEREGIKKKLVYGEFAREGGSIKISKGMADGKPGRPFKEMAKGERVWITEGIEDALSLALADPTRRIVSAVSLGNMGNVWLPDQCGGVVLVKDNDWDNPDAQKGFERARQAYRDRGLKTGVFETPADCGKDVNDWLRGEVA
ncbi:MAG: toprim domain-containing protein [Planctomycetota bacterium]